MEFNLAEKLGILKAIDQVILADDNVYEGEAIFVSQLSNVVGFSAELFREARKVEVEEAMGILEAMPMAKKEALAIMLNEAANSDGRVGEDELKIIYRIFRRIGIDFDEI
ncbi:TerB family tellurite resistance protein [Robiginitalea aurantiaca]|uniref:TerB family tellurite resistance protein n=1 Tax=Robiginitalea aurantiaca TaxID=3056915 RepID=A0ABT7WBI8_9FLAO|nr:TerB family tellurite resistance protein [Robiginitalea aurantiaca]MDM9630285.1 TerB family tellurite resistance protein [Robiginitalea aurantiaca]